MDHLVIPLDQEHIRALREIVLGAAAAAAIAEADWPRPHVTLVAHTPGRRTEVRTVVDEVTQAIEPFVIHAHGYGFFTGDGPSDLSLHVPVVRASALDALHRELCGGLADAGVQVAAWSSPDLWSPHITLFDRGLDPSGLGRATAWLAQRHHPSWRMHVDRVAIIGGRADPVQASEIVCFDR